MLQKKYMYSVICTFYQHDENVSHKMHAYMIHGKNNISTRKKRLLISAQY